MSREWDRQYGLDTGQGISQSMEVNIAMKLNDTSVENVLYKATGAVKSVIRF